MSVLAEDKADSKQEERTTSYSLRNEIAATILQEQSPVTCSRQQREKNGNFMQNESLPLALALHISYENTQGPPFVLLDESNTMYISFE